MTREGCESLFSDVELNKALSDDVADRLDRLRCQVARGGSARQLYRASQRSSFRVVNFEGESTDLRLLRLRRLHR